MTIPRFAALAVMASFLATPAIAQPATPSLAQEQQLAQEIAQLNWVNGPNTIEVANIAGFDIPAGYQMLTPPDSLKFIQLNGNATTTDDNGDYILQNVDPNSGWFAILTYEPIGHIKDIGPLNPTALLATLQALSTQDNANRAKQNIPPMTLTGWAVPPSYDPSTHTLQWALNFTNPDGSSLVNLNTDILGRTGALKIIVVDSPNTLAADLADFNHAMTGFSFNTGQRYQDAQTTDPATTLTLTALITGLTTQTPPPVQPPPPTTQPPRRQEPNHLPAIAKALTALAFLIAAGLGVIWWMRK
jgi:uncharacterized membrane-anchored protein